VAGMRVGDRAPGSAVKGSVHGGLCPLESLRGALIVGLGSGRRANSLVTRQAMAGG